MKNQPIFVCLLFEISVNNFYQYIIKPTLLYFEWSVFHLDCLVGISLVICIVLRSLLDNCKSADDAKYLLKNVPIKSNVNILVADKNGCSFVAETVSTLENKKVSFRENDEFLISTNHYMNADMFEYDNHRKRHSVVRYKTIQKALTESKGAVTSETIKTILEQKIQNGVFCPYYKDYLGTLHTTIFNVSNTNVQVCLGTPESSKWQEISFNAPVEIASISETVHNEYADDPKTFWSVLPPGCMEVK